MACAYKARATWELPASSRKQLEEGLEDILCNSCSEIMKRYDIVRLLITVLLCVSAPELFWEFLRLGGAWHEYTTQRACCLS